MDWIRTFVLWLLSNLAWTLLVAVASGVYKSWKHVPDRSVGPALAATTLTALTTGMILLFFPAETNPKDQWLLIWNVMGIGGVIAGWGGVSLCGLYSALYGDNETVDKYFVAFGIAGWVALILWLGYLYAIS